MARSVKWSLGLALFAAGACEGTSDGRTRQATAVHDSGFELITEYASRDEVGERLGSSRWFAEHQGWQEDPGYDASVVVSRHEVSREDSTDRRVTALVLYSVVGRIEATGDHMAFTPSQRVDTARFEAVRDPNGWKIVAPRQEPHIGIEAALAKLNLDSASRSLLLRLPRSR